MPRRSTTRSSICSASRRGRSSRISAATRARRAIRRAPRTPTTSISPPARSASAWRRRCSRRLVQDYVRAHGWANDRPEGRMIALVGDAETRRGQHFRGAARGVEAGAAQLLVDHRLQPAEPRRRDPRGPVDALRGDVPRLRLGRRDPQIRRRCRKRPSPSPAATLRAWIDSCPNQLYSALTFQGGAAWRKRLLDDLGDQGAGGAADRQALRRGARAADDQPRRPRPADAVEAFEAIDHDRPVCFIAYTIKGFGLPLAGHKDNHAGLMTPTQMEGYRATR